MPLFPPTAPVTVLIDGRPLAAYQRAYVVDGRVFVPLAPMLSRLADRAWYDGGAVVIERDGRRVVIFVGESPAERLEGAFVAAGPLLRGLGEDVRYRTDRRELEIRTREPVVASPAPFVATPQMPRVVFTPEPVATPRPVWSGSPLPRRTPITIGSGAASPHPTLR